MKVPLRVAVFLALWFAICAADGFSQDAPPDTDPDAAEEAGGGGDVKAVVVRDVRYAETLGVEAAAQSLDIYAIEGRAKCPVVIYVHGGGWKVGDKSRVHAKPAFFNAHGFVFVSINYRLLPAGQHPKNARDVARAIAWVHRNIARYGGAADRLFLMGHSAGAHLAALVASDSRLIEGAGLPADVLKGVVPLDTANYDIPRNVEENPLRRAEMVEALGADVEDWRDASPISFIEAGKNYPPFLLVHVGDRADSQRQSIAFALRLRLAGGHAAVVPAFDRDHGSLNQKLGEPGDEPSQAILKFFRECLAPLGDSELPSTAPGSEAPEAGAGADRREYYGELLRQLSLTRRQQIQLRAMARNLGPNATDAEIRAALQRLLTPAQWQRLLELDGVPNGPDGGENENSPGEAGGGPESASGE